MREIITKEQARESILKGVNKSALAISSTLGAKGKNVMIASSNRPLRHTKDGVSVANEIELEGLEGIGAKLVKEASSKTADVVGDGTTTAALLVQSLINEAQIRINAGADPILLKSGMDKAMNRVLEVLEKNKLEIKDKQIEFVASISANDPEIGKLLSEVFIKTGKDGVIEIEDSAEPGFKLVKEEGLRIDKGFASGYFITDGDRMEGVLNDASIIVSESRISNFKELVPILDKLVSAGKRNILIIADDFDDLVLRELIMNKAQGVFLPMAIKAPSFGEKRRDFLQDIALICGAKVVSDLTTKLTDLTLEDLGFARKVISRKDTTSIIEGRGDKEEIGNRVIQLNREISETKSEYEKNDIKARIGRLKNGVAIIKVGGSTDKEIKEKKDRVEDAVAATRAALEEGIVPGGGIALLNAKKRLKLKLEGDERKGMDCLKNALEAPFMKILSNGGKNGGDFIRKFAPKKGGYDIRIGKVVKDMFKEGIIDPFKVVKTCLLNSVSVAGSFIMSEMFILETKEK